MTARLAALAALALLAACAQPVPPPARQALVVVLPNGDGTVGAVSVDTGQGPLLLDRSYAAGEVRGGALAPLQMDEPSVHEVFAATVVARPIRPAFFRLFFVSASNQLTPESQAAYRAVFDDIKRRPVYEVEVVGHTDTLGAQAVNQPLSLQRATAVRDMLVRDGIASAAIALAGRGELDPAVYTANDVSEPRNRRVEITVR